MSDFKLIAIRPLNKCSKRFLKVLQKDQYYYFDNDYRIEGNKITFKPTQPSHLFYLANGKPVNISAIVGKNGSGKSSIMELLYVAIFNLSCKTKVLDKSELDGKKILPVDYIYVEMYFKIGDNYNCLKIEYNSIKLFCQSSNDGTLVEDKSNKMLNVKDLKSLFYTIVINYSQYSLNSLHTGKWITNIFHKNDGYQTPIVLNPFRVEGNIDFKNEEHLTFSRLLSNLLFIPEKHSIDSNKKNSIRELAPGKIASHFKITLNKKKAQFSKEEIGFGYELRKRKKEILDLVFEAFPISKIPSYETTNGFLKVAYDYILKKLFHIVSRYKLYKRKEFQFIQEVTSTVTIKGKKERKADYIYNEKKLKSFLKKLQTDTSHISFKLKQAINFIENRTFFEPKVNSYIEIDSISPALNKLALKSEKELIEIIPPSFFNIDIKFEDKGLFRSLSSGEKQRIFSSASYIYHLINLNSVIENDEHNKYRYALLVFDEIELYYHPELQRTFVKDFLDDLAKVPLPNIAGFNCIFITHSPFILSDIPSQNVLFLKEDGFPEENPSAIKTFGANIHELLATSFFLSNGYVGEFAKRKIEKLIAFYNKENSDFDEKSSLQMISVIGDDLISNRLLDMHNERFRKNVEQLNELDYEKWLISELSLLKIKKK